jgi:nicotinamidase-related amidase
MVRQTLLIIDPQNDFHGGGSLAVPGADEDAERIASFIRSSFQSIERLVITLDSHNKLHIAHGAFWKSGRDDAGEDKSPEPFTIITKPDVESKLWVPRNAAYTEHVLDYIEKLEASGKFKLIIWPEHCIVGSPGHCVVAPIHAAANEWSFHTGKDIEYVRKGENNLTEMYSALAAEVPLPDDARTHMNTELRDSLLPLTVGEQLIVCGQALSHCVNYTTRDLISGLNSDSDADILRRVVLLENCASAVPNCEAAAAAFVADCRTQGLTVCDVSMI